MLAGPPATDTGRRWRPGLHSDPRRVAMPFAYKLAYRLARLKHRTLAGAAAAVAAAVVRSEEHTSELQSQSNLVCRLLLAKKNSFLLSSRPCARLDLLAPQRAH